MSKASELIEQIKKAGGEIVSIQDRVIFYREKGSRYIKKKVFGLDNEYIQNILKFYNYPAINLDIKLTPLQRESLKEIYPNILNEKKKITIAGATGTGKTTSVIYLLARLYLKGKIKHFPFFISFYKAVSDIQEFEKAMKILKKRKWILIDDFNKLRENNKLETKFIYNLYEVINEKRVIIITNTSKEKILNLARDENPISSRFAEILTPITVEWKEKRNLRLKKNSF